MAKFIIEPGVRDLLKDVDSMASISGIDDKCLQMIKDSMDWSSLVWVMNASLRIMSRNDKKIVFLSGPLRHGGGDLHHNMLWMILKMKELQAKGIQVFNQLVFFEKISEYEHRYPDINPMEIFFGPALRSGYITDFGRLSGFDSSPNCLTELKIAKEENLVII